MPPVTVHTTDSCGGRHLAIWHQLLGTSVFALGQRLSDRSSADLAVSTKWRPPSGYSPKRGCAHAIEISLRAQRHFLLRKFRGFVQATGGTLPIVLLTGEPRRNSLGDPQPPSSRHLTHLLILVRVFVYLYHVATRSFSILVFHGFRCDCNARRRVCELSASRVR